MLNRVGHASGPFTLTARAFFNVPQDGEYWFSVYADQAAPLLPKGTMLKVTAWHDNTVANKNNPDPNVWVGYGDRTVDEMGHAWVNVTYLNDDEYAAEVEARRTQLTKGTR